MTEEQEADEHQGGSCHLNISPGIDLSDSDTEMILPQPLLPWMGLEVSVLVQRDVQASQKHGQCSPVGAQYYLNCSNTHQEEQSPWPSWHPDGLQNLALPLLGHL